MPVSKAIQCHFRDQQGVFIVFEHSIDYRQPLAYFSYPNTLSDKLYWQ